MAVRIGLLFLILCPYSALTGQSDQRQDFRANDELEDFLYSRLDAFLKNPTPDRLSIFSQIEDTIWRKPKSKAEYLAMAVVRCNEGFYRLRFGQIQRAVRAYEEAWMHHDRHGLQGFDFIEYCLKPLGNAYSMLGDYEGAESTIKTYLKIAQQQGDLEQQIAALINLSIVYHDTGQPSYAIGILRQAATKVTSKTPLKAGLIYSNLARNYLKLQDFEKAHAANQMAITIFTQQNEIEPLINSLSVMAQISLHRQDTSRAVLSLAKAKQLLLENREFSNRQFAKIEVQLGNVHQMSGNNSRAIKHFQSALQALIPTYEKSSILPVDSELFAENTLKEALDGMAQNYRAMDSLELALACYQKSFQVEELLRESFGHEESKLLQQNELRNRTEHIIGINYDLYVKTKNTSYLKSTFLAAERTKSINLREQVYKFNHGADSLHATRSRLTKERAHLQHLLTQEQLKGQSANIELIQELTAQKQKLTLEHKELSRYIRESQGTLSIDFSLDSLQARLAGKHINLIEYFLGRDALYRFEVSASQIRVHRDTAISEIDRQIRAFLNAFRNSDKINADPAAFAELSHELYQYLFSDVHLTSQTLIIPDGLLNFVPFDALVTDKPQPASYAKWPWLLQKTTIFNHYSAQLFLNKPSSGVSSGNVLAMFPEFVNTPQHLKYAQDEAASIQEYWEGTFLTQENATRKNFEARAVQYEIIHLSTHAQAGHLLEPPSIQFIDSTMYLPEIQNLKLRTKLLVLGACETGLGKVYKGESPLSLASGFFRIGVQNLIFSLWKVNDHSTSELMASFYQHLTQTTNPHASLRQAKIDYLTNPKTSLEKQSPYYWAGFVYYGTNTSVNTSHTNNTILWTSLLSGGLLLVWLASFFLKKRNV